MARRNEYMYTPSSMRKKPVLEQQFNSQICEWGAGFDQSRFRSKRCEDTKVIGSRYCKDHTSKAINLAETGKY